MTHSIARRSAALASADRIEHGFDLLLNIVRCAAGVFILYWYVFAVLECFPATRPHAQTLLRCVTDPVFELVRQFAATIPNLVTITVIACIGYYVSRITKLIFQQAERGAIELPLVHADTAPQTSRVVQVVLLAAVVMIAFPYIPGSGTPGFKGATLLIGALISLGSTGIMASLLSGLVLIYMRPFRVGNRVTIGETSGVLLERTFLVSRIRTPQNLIVTIANSTILSSQIVNYSAPGEPVRLRTQITIGYNTPWRQVEALLLQAASRTSGLTSDPSPFVHITALEDFYVRYALHVHTKDATYMEGLYSELHSHILDAFNEYGVQIMSPNYEADRSQPAVVRPEHWYAAPASRPDSGNRR